MGTKILSAVIMLFLVLAALPGAEAEDNGEEDYLLKAEGYRSSDPDGYCIKATPGIGPDVSSTCINSQTLASLAPNTGEVRIDEPDSVDHPSELDDIMEKLGNLSGKALGSLPRVRDLQREADLDSLVHDTGLAPDDLPLWVDAPCDVNKVDHLIVEMGRRVVCENMDLRLEAVIVEPAAMLVLKNSTLTFSEGENPKFEVKSEYFALGDVRHPYHGGTLVMEGSRVVGDPEENVYLNIEQNAVVRVDQSEFEHVGSVSVRTFEQGGAREFSFTNSTMKGGWGMRLAETNAYIQGSFFDGVRSPVVTGGETTVDGNSITGCSTGVVGLKDAALTLTNNTITNCDRVFVHGNTEECFPAEVRWNDLHGLGGGALASFCGDARGNYWGREPVEEMFGNEPSSGFYHGDVDYSEWSEVPLHPERLPEVALSFDEKVVVDEEVEFNAAESRGSRLFGFPLESFDWEFQLWEEPVRTACTDGCKRSGPVHPASTNAGEALTHVFESTGRHTVSVTVIDGKGFQHTETATVRVVSPHSVDVPVEETLDFESAVIHPRSPIEGDPLTVEVNGPDNIKILDHTLYTWYRDGEVYEYQVSRHNEEIPENTTRAGEIWGVEVLDNRSQPATVIGYAKVYVGDSDDSGAGDREDEQQLASRDLDQDMGGVAGPASIDPHRSPSSGLQGRDSWPAPVKESGRALPWIGLLGAVLAGLVWRRRF